MSYPTDKLEIEADLLKLKLPKSWSKSIRARFRRLKTVPLSLSGWLEREVEMRQLSLGISENSNGDDESYRKAKQRLIQLQARREAEDELLPKLSATQRRSLWNEKRKREDKLKTEEKRKKKLLREHEQLKIQRQQYELRKRIPQRKESELRRMAAKGEILSHKDAQALHPHDEHLLCRLFDSIAKIRRVRKKRQARKTSLEFFIRAKARRTAKHEKIKETKLRRKIGGLRRRKQIAPYATFLLKLFDTYELSEQAKQRAANGLRLDDYHAVDRSDYARANYRRSRDAREKDYWLKETYLGEAVALADAASVTCGHQEVDEFVPYVIYFDLTTGQVSFHSNDCFDTEEYEQQWDGDRQSGSRIYRAFEQLFSQE